MQNIYSYVDKCIDFVKDQLNNIPNVLHSGNKNIVELNGKQYYIRTSNAFKNRLPYFSIDESEKNMYYGFIFVKYCGKKNIQIWGVKKSEDIFHTQNGFYIVYKDELDSFDEFIKNELNKSNQSTVDSGLFMLELKKLCTKFNVDINSILSYKDNDEFELELIKNKELLAKAIEINEGWKVKKGSKALTSIVPSLRKNIRELRLKLEGSGVVSYNTATQTLDFNKDYVFKTLSEAACFILAREVNGRDCFKVKGTNQSYNQFVNKG